MTSQGPPKIVQIHMNHPVQLHKLVAIEFAPSNGKNVSHLQIHTFCHFDFFNDRRNGFSAVGASRRETRQESEEA